MWQTPGLTANQIPSPVSGDGMVYAMGGFRGNMARAVKLSEAKGELTGPPGLVWSYDKDTPYVPSPLLYRGGLYFLKTNSGILTYLDAPSGQPKYTRAAGGGAERLRIAGGCRWACVRDGKGRHDRRARGGTEAGSAGDERAGGSDGFVSGAGRRRRLPARRETPVSRSGRVDSVVEVESGPLRQAGGAAGASGRDGLVRGSAPERPLRGRARSAIGCDRRAAVSAAPLRDRHVREPAPFCDAPFAMRLRVRAVAVRASASSSAGSINCSLSAFSSARSAGTSSSDASVIA